MAQPAIKLPPGITEESVKLKLQEEAKAAFEFQKRRHKQWDENYLLYRDKVKINRLTQRQAINVPIMKETIRTILPKIDAEPDLSFEDKGGDLDKEIIINTKWQEDYRTNSVGLIDYVDKKQVLIYGRSHKKLNWTNNTFSLEIKDAYDVLVDPKTNPIDIETARYIVEPHIYRPLDEILVEERYDKEARRKLKNRVDKDRKGTKNRSHQNKKMADARNERMKSMGEVDSLDKFEAYDHIEEITQHFTYLWDKKQMQMVRYVFVYAGSENEMIILRSLPIKEAIGVDIWPFESWADDLEITDYYSDAIADMIRVPNQTLNIWISQLMENRTLRNYGMNFYDKTKSEDFIPETMEPRPFGWYPLPGKPSEVYQRVDIPELSGTKEDIQFLISLVEKASATGAIDKGVIEDTRRTLGEIEIAVGKAEQRTTSMSKFYRKSWERMGNKWYLLHEANIQEGQTFKLYKKNPIGKLVGREFQREDWYSEQGYKVSANPTNEKTSEKVENIQRLMAVRQEFPDNPPLVKAIQRRLIGLAELTPEESQEIESYEAQKIMSQVDPAAAIEGIGANLGAGMGAAAAPNPTGQPGQGGSLAENISALIPQQ